MNKRKILITGGAGFIGTNLCEKLLKDGSEVICLDNYYTGSEKNILHLKKYPNFEFIKHDITTTFYAEADEIYNLVCPASPIHYQSNPIKTLETSVTGSTNMLELAKRLNAKILQASTSEVYGDPEKHPQTESYWGNVNPIGIRSCYDEGKRCAETLFMDYYRQHNIPIKIIRIFNTYGPNMSINDGRVISNFIIQALTGKNITVYGDGNQTRSFQYVDDLINAMVKMMNTEALFTGPINIGNPEEYTMLEIAGMIIDITGSKSGIVFKPLPADDPKHRCPDISLAKEKLNWEPVIKLKEGLVKTIEYFDTILRLNTSISVCSKAMI